MTSLQPNGRADLHMHTSASDGTMTVNELLAYVAQIGTLDVIAITDHDRIDASLWAYERRHRYPFDIVPGVEVSSADGHVLALWVTQNIPAGLTLRETAQAIHEAGGLAVIAHPCHYYMPDHTRHALRHMRNPHLLVEAEIDAVEAHNAGIFIAGVNVLAHRLAKAANLPMVGGSDAHTLGAIGTGQTHFPGRTAADLRASIVAGTTRAAGTAWPRREYRLFVRDMIARRGRCDVGIFAPIEEYGQNTEYLTGAES